MKVYFMEQGSDDWFDIRKGKPTASRFDMILTAAKLQPSAQQDTLIDELIGERLSLIPPEGVENFTNRAIRWGEHCEKEARAWYTLETGREVQKVGFIENDRFGCSPDGLVGMRLDEVGNFASAEGAIELKCPQAETQVRYVRKGVLPFEYRAQVHGHLIVTGLPWVDFLSFSPGIPPLLVRVEPDDFTKRLAEELDRFYLRFQAELSKFVHSDPAEVAF